MNTGEYDWVLWIDADAAFRPPERTDDIEGVTWGRGASSVAVAADVADGADSAASNDKLRKVLFTYRDLDAVFSEDHPRDPLLNSGVMMFRNTAYTHSLLNYYNLATATTADANACFVRGKTFKTHDQGCVRHSYADNVLDLQNHSVIVPYGVVQSFSIDDRKFPRSIIVHASGLPAAKRVLVFEKMLRDASQTHS